MRTNRAIDLFARVPRAPTVLACVTTLAMVACSGNFLSGTPFPQPSFTSITAPSSQYPTATAFIPTGLRQNLMTLTVQEPGGLTVGAVNAQNGTPWTTLAYPGAVSTQAYGPDVTSTGGFVIMGSYTPPSSSFQSGYAYDSASNTYTTLNAPGALCGVVACTYTIMHSAYGDSGSYLAVGNADGAVTPPDFGVYPTTGHAILYTASTATFSNIDITGALSSTAYGIWIDGSTEAVAGGFTDSIGTHAYVRDIAGTEKLVYDYPGAVVTHFEGITGMGGAGNYNVIGDATIGTAINGFILPIRNWKLGLPTLLGPQLSANSVFVTTVVGIYTPAATGSTPVGYIAKVPTR